MLRTATLLVLILLLLNAHLMGQERTPIEVPKFGRVPKEHKELTSIPSDPDADIEHPPHTPPGLPLKAEEPLNGILYIA